MGPEATGSVNNEAAAAASVRAFLHGNPGPLRTSSSSSSSSSSSPPTIVSAAGAAAADSGRRGGPVVMEAIEIPQFIGRSYLTYDNPNILKRVSGSRTNVFMRFKTALMDGLLLWRGDSPMRSNSDFISLGLQDGSLVFSYNLGSGIAYIIVNGSFNDGRWHKVKAVRDGQSGKITVDDYGARTGKSPGMMRQLNINGDLYVGGMKEIALHTNRQYMRGLVGCISHFTLSTDFHISLVEDAADGKNINTCGRK